MDQLDSQQIRSAASSALTIEIVDCCESTNTLLMEKTRHGAPQGSVLACEWQTAGRGRNGHHWHSPRGTGLTFSLLWHFKKKPQALAGLSLAVGIALIRTIKKLGVSDIQLKWPNDVLWHYRKLAGILIESFSSAETLSAIIGIGINISLPKEERERIDQKVTDLEEATGKVINRNQLLGMLLSELARILITFDGQGFYAFKEEWIQHDAYHNQAVLLTDNTNVIHGEMRGIDEEGALLLAIGTEVKRFFSGNLSLQENEHGGCTVLNNVSLRRHARFPHPPTPPALSGSPQGEPGSSPLPQGEGLGVREERGERCEVARRNFHKKIS